MVAKRTTTPEDRELLRELAKDLNFRALRGDRRQVEIAIASGVSQGVISQLERYGPAAVTGAALKRVLDFYVGLEV